jgi:hypothetical protein
MDVPHFPWMDDAIRVFATMGLRGIRAIGVPQDGVK